MQHIEATLAAHFYFPGVALSHCHKTKLKSGLDSSFRLYGRAYQQAYFEVTVSVTLPHGTDHVQASSLMTIVTIPNCELRLVVWSHLNV